MATIYLETGEKMFVVETAEQLDEIVKAVNSGPLWPFFITVTVEVAAKTPTWSAASTQQRVNVDKIVRYS